jgi:hypothetical protein
MSKDQSEGINHVVFDEKQEESDDMDVEDKKFTAEEIQQLYNQSSATTGSFISQDQKGNGGNNGEDMVFLWVFR